MLARLLLTGTVAVLLLSVGFVPAWAETTTEATLRVEGMTCPGCEATVEAVLGGIAGVAEARADRHTETALVRFDPSRTGIDQLVAAINSQTYYVASLGGTDPGTAAGSGAAAGSSDAAVADAGSSGPTAAAPWLIGGLAAVGAGAWLATRLRHRHPDRA